VGEIPQSGKNASENLIRRTFDGVTFRSIIGSPYCPGILLAGLQAEVAAIIFSPAILHGRVRHYEDFNPSVDFPPSFQYPFFSWTFLFSMIESDFGFM
jgi:hypothetical protein